ncbi:PAS domain S-box protein [Chitinivorax sp. B]|uniref:PAS domain S-box protein n=1 Tax=Chitinivorax sp. B TaxID=2502235 RepID=UPI0010F80F8A|nr:PAS domain S-box protein [Chitinivorax sp. B]
MTVPNQLNRLRGTLGRVILLIATCIVSISCWQIWQSYVDIRQEIDTHNRILVNHLTLQVDNTLDSLWRLTDNLAESGELAELINGPENTLHEKLAALHRAIPAVVRFMVYNNRGVAVASSHELPTKRIVINDREYFRFLQNNRSDRIYVAHQTTSRYDQQPVVPIGRRIETPQGGFAGILSSPLDHRFLQSWLESLRLPSGTTLMLTREDGEVLLRYPRTHSLPQDHVLIGTAQILQQAGEQTRFFADRISPDEPLLYGAFRKLKRSDVIVVAGIEQSVAINNWRDKAGWTAMIGVLFLGGLIIAWWWLDRRFDHLAEAEYRWQRAQAIIDASPDMVFGLDGNGRFQYVNETANQKLGYTNLELIGRNLPDIAPNFPLGTYIQHYQQLRTGNTSNIESMLQGANGERFPVEISTKLMSLPDAEMLIAFGRDVTQRKDAERELARLNERWQMLTVSVRIGIAEWDVVRNVLDCDPTMVEIYGFPTPQVTVDAWVESIHPEDKPRLQAEMDSMQRMGGTIDSEFRIVRRDGAIRHVRGYMLMERSSGGGVPRIVGLNIDITDRRRAEAMVQTVLRVTSTSVGENFFRTLVVELSRALGVRYASVGSFLTGVNGVRQKHTLARADNTRLLPNIEYPVQGSPSELVLEQKVCVFANHVQERFPNDFRMADMNIQSLVSVALRNGKGDVIGSLAIMDDKPMADPSQATTLLTIIATRAAAELERLQAEAALKQEQRYIERVLLYSPAIICSMTSTGLIRRINQAYQTITGNVPQDAIGRSWRDVFAPDVVDYQVEQFLQRGGGEMEHAIFTRNGETRMLIWKTTGPRGSEDDAADIIAVGVDVTMRRSAEAEIRKLNAELEKRVVQRTAQLQASMRELESFSYSVSHDLRAPLRSIAGFSSILLEDYTEHLDESGRDYLQRIVNSAARLSHLIDDMLNLSRISRQRLSAHEIDLAPIASQIIEDLRFNEPNRTISWICPTQLPAHADERLIRIVLENLLRNAWKFSAKHDSATIEVGVKEDQGKRIYFVKDDGAGFDMRHAARLFGAFQRLHDASEFEGTGIGLAIVQRVIHRHGGTVWAEGEVDKGATIFFTLPPPDPTQPTDIEFENRPDDDEELE